MVKYETLANGFVKAYSDAWFYIHGGNPEGDYVAAVDHESAGRIYKETDIKIETNDETAPDGDAEATVEDYQTALKSLGVNIDEKETA
jgi:hypothetical protein